MAALDWQAELRDWCRSRRNITPALAESIVAFFRQSFENTLCPRRAWYGIHSSGVSLVVGGIYLSALHRNGSDRGVWLLMSQARPDIDGLTYSRVASSRDPLRPLYWGHAQSLQVIPDLVTSAPLWESFRAASQLVLTASTKAADRDATQLQRGKHRLSEFWIKTNPDVLLSLPQDSGTRTTPSDLTAMSVAEGQERLQWHRTRERNRGLIARKKRLVLAEFGRLACEVCDFDFAAAYGLRGDGFAECHHTQPISQSVAGRCTSLSDLAIVCANCHRMLHRRPWVLVQELRELWRSRLRSWQQAEAGDDADSANAGGGFGGGRS